VRTDTVGTSEETRNLNFSNLIFNGLIIGPSYEFTYNSLAGLAKTNKFYFNGLADFSGNILGLVQGAKPESPKELFGAHYAQYMKYQVDFRHYLQWAPDPHNVLASRIIVGVGLPYGNSSQLPNVKQFFSGGNSSLRGFRSRLVGPGTYNERYLYGTNTFLESLGDIKLEFNTEFRANLYQFLNGAVFLDVGNIWLAKENPSFPGGHFTSNWINELAADVGVGLRFDFQILILRLDLATPIRKPWLPEGERMVFNQINFSSPEWRRDNLILNIAIGYPF
jgi:outer membrane protein insertion porin family